MTTEPLKRVGRLSRCPNVEYVVSRGCRDRAAGVRKTVDVFLGDRLVASYPVVLEANNPTDQDFIQHVRRYMRRHYSKEDIAAARFAVGGLLDWGSGRKRRPGL
jgi:hypothetical protein